MTRLDRVRLEGLQVECIVGIAPSERTRHQPLELNIDLYFDSRRSSRGGGLAASVDYAQLAGEMRFLLEASRFILLEEAAEALARYVLLEPIASAPRAQVEEVAITIKKPHALAGFAVPSLKVHRNRDEVRCDVETTSFGEVDVIYETKPCGIYRLRLAPGGVIPLHVHREMDEHELVLGGGLTLQNEPVAAGSGRRWPKDLAHTYGNPTDVEQAILCVDLPRFIRADEIPVDGPPADLAGVEVTQYYPEWKPDA